MSICYYLLNLPRDYKGENDAFLTSLETTSCFSRMENVLTVHAIYTVVLPCARVH